jgi:hypothetical protein
VIGYKNAYVKAVSSRDYQLALHWMNLLNCCLTPKFRISDLPDWELNSKDFNYSSKIQQSARQFCFKNMPLVESALTLERATLYSNYHRDD